jgi:hypothetical protein
LPQKFKIVGTYTHDHSLESSWGALSHGTISLPIHFSGDKCIFWMFLKTCFKVIVSRLVKVLLLTRQIWAEWKFIINMPQNIFPSKTAMSRMGTPPCKIISACLLITWTSLHPVYFYAYLGHMFFLLFSIIWANFVAASGRRWMP